MGARPDQLRAELQRTREDLATHLSELKTEASRVGRQAAMIAGAVVAAYVGFRIIRAFIRRGRS